MPGGRGNRIAKRFLVLLEPLHCLAPVLHRTATDAVNDGRGTLKSLLKNPAISVKTGQLPIR